MLCSVRSVAFDPPLGQNNCSRSPLPVLPFGRSLPLHPLCYGQKDKAPFGSRRRETTSVQPKGMTRHTWSRLKKDLCSSQFFVPQLGYSLTVQTAGTAGESSGDPQGVPTGLSKILEACIHKIPQNVPDGSSRAIMKV